MAWAIGGGRSLRGDRGQQAHARSGPRPPKLPKYASDHRTPASFQEHATA
jgi:hypothetical protein